MMKTIDCNAETENESARQTTHNSHPNRCQGKVARLPLQIRTLVNTMLDDGATYESICAKLAELGHPGFLTQNISRWKQRGYEDWCAERERRELTKSHAEAAFTLVQELKDASTLGQANEILLAAQTYRALLEFQKFAPDQLVGDNSSKFLQFSRAITAQLSQRTRRERLQLDHDYRQQKLALAQTKTEQRQQAATDYTQPLTGAQREAFLDKIDELFGIRPEIAALQFPFPCGSLTATDPQLSNLQSEISEISNPNPKPETSNLEPATPNTLAHPSTPLNAPEISQPESPPPIPNQFSISNSQSDPGGASVPASRSPKIRNLNSPRPEIPGAWPQPPGAIPIINAIGAIVAWAAGPDGPPPNVPLRDPTAFAARSIYNKRGQTILWFDGNASTPNAPNRYPATHDHFIPVLNQQGMVIDWRPWDEDADNSSLANLPSDAPGPRPILTHIRYGQTIAWLTDS